VKTDLRPYVCLMDNCVCPYQAFSRKIDWLFHMESKHNRKIIHWRCGYRKHTSPQIFGSEEEFKAHLEYEHNAASETLRAVLLKRSGRTAPEMFTHCPFCDWSPYLENKNSSDGSANAGAEDPTHSEAKEEKEIRPRDRLHKHIADHLEMIALRSLTDESMRYLN
jgi:hypothetical protein